MMKQKRRRKNYKDSKVMKQTQVLIYLMPVKLKYVVAARNDHRKQL